MSRALAGVRLATVVVAAALAAGVTPAVAQAAPTGDNVVLQWDSAMLTGVRTGKLGPPMVSRAFQVLHTCTYDAWAAYDRRAVGTRFGGALRRPVAEHTTANKNKAISYAAYAANVDIFPELKSTFDALMRSLGYDPAATGRPGSPEAVGTKACRAVLDFRHRDGANQLGDLHAGPYSDYTGWTPKNDPMDVLDFDRATVKDPDYYQPLTHPVLDGSTVTDGFLGAQWGKVRLFAVEQAPARYQAAKQDRLLEELRERYAPGPAPYGSQAYIDQANAVRDLQANLTDREKVIAEYWADGPRSETPAGHWMLMSQEVSRRDRHTVDQDAKMFFAVANAQADATVACWYVKRYYDYVRPITAIRYLYDGQPIQGWAGPNQGVKTIDGGTWRPYQKITFPTPPFSEYVSGHSSFGSATTEVLRSFTGSDRFGESVTIKAGSMVFEQNLPAQDVTLSWPTFSAAAAEVGISRRYGGIHFEDGDLHGRALGTAVGRLDWALAQRYFTGTI